MAWSFDVASNIPRLNQSGTDAGLAGIATAIAAHETVARSTAYTTSRMVKPPTPTGFWYRCSTAGTTAASAPTYGTTLAGTTTDGTAVFTAFKAPDIQTLGTTNHYYMPDIRMAINGTLTNTNVQQQNFTCFDLIIFTGNFTSGAYASDGVTPLWDGLHFAAVRSSASGADGTSMNLQAGGQFTFIGGEVQTGGGVTFDNGTTPRSYLTRWRNTKEYGASSARFRSSTVNAIFENVEAYDFAFDLFRMPTVAPSIKARGAEYVYQYVGSGAGGADAKFAASNLENPNGTFDFDNYFGGWVELYNCAKGANLNVVSQFPNSSVWVRHCVPLYQDIVITAKDTTGAAVQAVRFTATESPTDAPTVTFTTISSLKTWDFRTPLSYQTTTNASGIALSSPVLNVWYWQNSFKQSLRFPASTATFQGRAYNYKTMTVSAVLGASAAIPVSAGMISLDTATTMSEAAALALPGVTFYPEGTDGGTMAVTQSYPLPTLWSAYRAYISQFANSASNDTWTCLASAMSMGAWNLVVFPSAVISAADPVTSVNTTGRLTLVNSTYKSMFDASGVLRTDGTILPNELWGSNYTYTGAASITALYEDSTGPSVTVRMQGVSATGVAAIWHSGTNATEFFQVNNTGSAASYDVYYPPGSVGLVKNYARELYGSQRVGGSITLVAGLNTISFIDIPDVGITEPVQATVAAYTAIETASKFYDRTAAFRLSEQGIKLGQIATRSGTAIEIGTFNHVINQAAAVVYAILSGTITTKSTAYAGDSKYVTEIATPPATITAATTEVVTIAREDANGDSQINIQASGISTFEVWKITNATPPDNYATGTLVATVPIGIWRFLSAPGFKFVIRDTTTNFRVVNTADKGIYSAALFFGDQVQLAQAPEVTGINTKVDVMQVDIDAIKGTGFTSAKNSLVKLKKHVTAMSQA